MAMAARERVETMDTNELAHAFDEWTVIDVREDRERIRGYIPGSSHVARGVLERDIEKIVFGGNANDEDLKRPIALYCARGVRSLLAAEQLIEMGFERVVSVDGGFAAWAESGRDVVIDR